MTPERAADPGPRTAAHPGGLGAASVRGLPVVVLVLLLVVVGACGSSNLPAGSPSAPGLSGPGSSALAGDASGSPGAPDPSRPHWPGTTVLATIALGAADGEIQKAGIDLQKAADTQDLRAMWGAADGLAKMIDGLTPNIARLEIYPETQAAAAIYRVAFPELSAGAKQLRDAITAGDSAGVVAGSQQIAKGLADYAPVRELIAGLVEQAIVQQRLLTQ